MHWPLLVLLLLLLLLLPLLLPLLPLLLLMLLLLLLRCGRGSDAPAADGGPMTTNWTFEIANTTNCFAHCNVT